MHSLYFWIKRLKQRRRRGHNLEILRANSSPLWFSRIQGVPNTCLVSNSASAPSSHFSVPLISSSPSELFILFFVWAPAYHRWSTEVRGQVLRGAVFQLGPRASHPRPPPSEPSYQPHLFFLIKEQGVTFRAHPDLIFTYRLMPAVAL